MVEFQLGEFLIPSLLLSRNLRLGDFEDSAQEPSVPFNIEPATHPTGFSDFQFSEVSSSNHSTVAHSDSPNRLLSRTNTIYFSYADSRQQVEQSRLQV